MTFAGCFTFFNYRIVIDKLAVFTAITIDENIA